MLKILPIFFLIVSCSKDSGSIENKSIKTNEGNRSSISPKSQIDFRLLEGAWADGQSQNASFLVRNGTIYYPDQENSFKIIVKGDSIIILYSEWTYKGLIQKLTKDSLLLTDENGTNKYYRFK